MSDSGDKTTLGGTLANTGIGLITTAAAAVLIVGVSPTALIAGGMVLLVGVVLIMFGVRMATVNAADKDKTISVNQIKPLVKDDEPIKPSQLIESQIEKREPSDPS